MKYNLIYNNNVSLLFSINFSKDIYSQNRLNNIEYKEYNNLHYITFGLIFYFNTFIHLISPIISVV